MAQRLASRMLNVLENENRWMNPNELVKATTKLQVNFCSMTSVLGRVFDDLQMPWVLEWYCTPSDGAVARAVGHMVLGGVVEVRHTEEKVFGFEYTGVELKLAERLTAA